MCSFFTEIIGLRLVHQTPDGKFAELRDKCGFCLQIKGIDLKEGQLSHLHYGYAPILNF